MTPDTATSPTIDREITITRIFDAPRELVFDAFTDPMHIGEWWGPDGFTITTDEMDVRVGGTWRFVRHGPDGVDYPNRITYTEISRPERLAYDHGDDGDPPVVSFKATIRFAEREGKTELTMSSLFPTAAERDRVVEEHGAIEGGKQTLARLAAYLEAQADA
jgi:uncharacterized protein YndB with AHSA1/START domain